MAAQGEANEGDRAPREGTDESLRVEREKVDSKIAEKRASADEDADNVVRTARQLADDVLQHERSRADLVTPAANNARVETERTRADTLLDDKRSREDSMLLEQRSERSRYLVDFLAVEREATDSNLVRERSYSDTQVSTRDEFLATVSHDMRNLLGGLGLNATLLLKYAPEGPDGDRIRRHATASQRLVARMTRLANDLLDLASIDAGKLSVVPDRVEVGKILRDTLDAFQPVAVAKGVRLDVACAATPLQADLDAGRVLQVLANLVSNAIKFTAAGGRVSISARADKDEIHFEVDDTGIGIPDELLPAIFERFRQISRDRRGLGLGLHISKCIVEAHGGRMWAESKVGSGSAFHFALPASKASAAAGVG